MLLDTFIVAVAILCNYYENLGYPPFFIHLIYSALFSCSRRLLFDYLAFQQCLDFERTSYSVILETCHVRQYNVHVTLVSYILKEIVALKTFLFGFVK